MDTYKEIWSNLLAGDRWEGMLKNRKKSGESYYLFTTIISIKEKDEKIAEFISIQYEITDAIKRDQLIEYYTTDTLTGLPNRYKLRDELKSNQNESMLIFIDINNFGSINNLYGEKIGNEVLLETSEKLKNLVSDKEASLYKFHGDQFAILIRKKELFDKYFFLIKYSLLLGEAQSDVDSNLVISYTVGISYGNENLFHKSNMALRDAKKRGVDVVIYDASLNIEETQKLNMARLKVFKEALQNGNIMPYFQPIVDAKTNEVIKYEAVARLINENGRVVSPDMFLDVAKQSRLFQYFTRQVMQKIFYVASKNDIEISINLIYEDISSKEVVEYIKNRLESHKKRNITFEIVESEDIVDYRVIEKFIKMAKGYGCKISIDDFGSGYSNFSYLFKLEKDYLKIDGSIIEKIETDKNSQNLVKMLVDFAKINEIKIIAEYVSSKEIAQKLKELGVDYLQGYYFGKPQPAEFYGLL